jgi:hypothetical protein
MNYVPIFFEKVLISKNYGLNMAYWNFHERSVSIVEGIYKINKTINLVFFHFSNYKAENKDVIASYFTRFLMSETPIIEQLYSKYHERLINNRYFENKEVYCVFVKQREEYLEQMRQEELRKELEALKKESIRKKIVRFIKLKMPNKFNLILFKYNQI